MKKTELMTKMSRAMGRVGLKIKKHSPEILVAAGVIGTVTSTVMACKATTKVSAIMDSAKEQIDVIHSCMETGECLGEDYTPEDGKKDLAIVYTQTGMKFVKLYGPSVLLGAASLGCILTSHKILRKRNIALGAAYAVVDKGFKEYRGRVIDRFGEELDRELKYNIKTKEIEKPVVNEDGTETMVKETVEVAHIDEESEYDRFYDDGCKGWVKDAESNLAFLLQVQNWANEKLRAQGYLFLNDVYKMLGIKATAAGQQVGWIYNEEHPLGDNYVDFGIYDINDKQKRRFVNGYERVILLSFNVDGVILDYI